MTEKKHRKLTTQEYLRIKRTSITPKQYMPSTDDALIKLNILEIIGSHQKRVRPTYAFNMYDTNGKFKPEWYDEKENQHDRKETRNRDT